MVVKGYSHRKGDQTFSPLAKGSTTRALVSIAASKRITLTQFDVIIVFIYGELDEDLYINQLDGLHEGTERM